MPCRVRKGEHALGGWLGQASNKCPFSRARLASVRQTNIRLTILGKKICRRIDMVSN